MKKRIAMPLLILTLLLTLSPGAQAAAFRDLPPDAWYADAVLSLNRADLLWLEEGRMDFPASAPLTTCELDTLTARLTGGEAAAADAPETPVSRETLLETLHTIAGDLAAEENAAQWAVEAGLLQGYPDGSLQLQRTVTWAEAAALANRFFTWRTLETLGIRTREMEGSRWYCLQDICRAGGIQLTEEGDRLLLREGALTVELRIGDQYLRRDGYLMNSISAAPVGQEGQVWVPPDLFHRVLTAGKAVLPSLYYGVFFYEEEVLAAVETPALEHHADILSQVSLPTSMGIDLLRVDRSRLFDDTPVADLPASYAGELRYWGFDAPETLCYTEYQVAAKAQTLRTFLDMLYAEDPDLAPYNPYGAEFGPDRWTYGEYERRRTEAPRDPWQVAGLDAGDPADRERIRFLEERDIQPGDVHFLQKEFHNDYMGRTDQELREVIEAYYRIYLFGPGGETGA